MYFAYSGAYMYQHWRLFFFKLLFFSPSFPNNNLHGNFLLIFKLDYFSLKVVVIQNNNLKKKVVSDIFDIALEMFQIDGKKYFDNIRF